MKFEWGKFYNLNGKKVMCAVINSQGIARLYSEDMEFFDSVYTGNLPGLVNELC